MAWTYSDYVTYDQTSATRLTRLRLHIQEISDRITEDYKIAGREKDVSNLREMLKDLKAEETRLVGITSRTNRRAFTQARAV